jgi:hypothetical protein
MASETVELGTLVDGDEFLTKLGNKGTVTFDKETGNMLVSIWGRTPVPISDIEKTIRVSKISK